MQILLYERVKETLIKSFKYSTVFCIAVFISMELLNNEIAWLFGGNNSSEFYKLASKAIRIAGISIPIMGFELVSANYFQYIGKAKESIVFISLKQIIFLIPAVFILPLFIGINGIFTSSVVADILTFIIMVFFFTKEFKDLTNNIKAFN